MRIPTLDVIIEGQVVMPVLLKKTESIAVGEVFKLNQSVLAKSGGILFVSCEIQD